MNYDKSTFLFSSNINEMDKSRLATHMGMRISSNSERYLRLPNMMRREKEESFQMIKDRITQMISQWNMRTLSQGGKETFIKSVLQSIPSYAMSCFLLPRSFCGELGRICDRYWWQHNPSKRGIH